MQSEVNIEDELSLGYFRTTLGLNNVSNNADTIKKCGEFEHHDQFVLEVGKEILINGFKTFMENKIVPANKSFEEAKILILGFLEEFDIKYFYDEKNYNQKDAFQWIKEFVQRFYWAKHGANSNSSLDMFLSIMLIKF